MAVSTPSPFAERKGGATLPLKGVVMTNKTRPVFHAERETEALITIAQDSTKHANIRLGATRMLWDIYGDHFLGLIAAKSRALNSDWSLQGLSDKDRCVRISGQVFMLFWKVVLKFDLTKGVKFLATAFEVCRECPKGYTDTEVADRMGICKVQVGNLRRQAFELLERAGLIAKYRGILAA